MMADLCGQDSDIFVDSLKSEVMKKYLDGDESLLQVLVDLGLFDDSSALEKRGTPVDTLAAHLAQTLPFGKKDRDLCILRHDITCGTLNGHRETHSFTLSVYGTVETPEAPAITAMAKCVGASAGISAKMVLDGEIERRGVVIPITPDCYRPMLARLAQEGIEAVEKVTRHK